jgi:hypothetical protein
VVRIKCRSRGGQAFDRPGTEGSERLGASALVLLEDAAGQHRAAAVGGPVPIVLARCDSQQHSDLLSIEELDPGGLKGGGDLGVGDLGVGDEVLLGPVEESAGGAALRVGKGHQPSFYIIDGDLGAELHHRCSKR